jgi:hypothetical protein
MVKNTCVGNGTENSLAKSISSLLMKPSMSGFTSAAMDGSRSFILGVALQHHRVDPVTAGLLRWLEVTAINEAVELR